MDRQGLPDCRERPLNSSFRCSRATKSTQTQEQQQAREMQLCMRGMWSRAWWQGQMLKQAQASLRRTLLSLLRGQPASQGQGSTVWTC